MRDKITNFIEKYGLWLFSIWMLIIVILCKYWKP